VSAPDDVARKPSGAGVRRSTSPFQPARGRRAFDDIIEQLRKRLKNDELKSGDRLPSERDLAEQFQVSRNTVREALRMLEIAGLIKIRKGSMGGGFISEADPKVVARSLSDMLSLMSFSLADLTEARLVLGPMIARLAAKRATDADIEQLQANVDEASALTEHAQWERRAQVNHEFLNLLATATANPVLEMFQRSLTEVIREIVDVIGPLQDEGIVQSRKRLLRAVRARDGEKAAHEMERHLKRVHTAWLNGTRALSSS
jgi:GntR family transcriptional repressor for pyruvate dehydrogenase complex